jgi:plastocyanin
VASTAFRVLTVALASLTTGCSASTFGAGNAAPIATTHIVVLNLTKYRPVSTPYGESGGYKPAVLTVRVGDTIVFMDSDTVGHTASYIASATRFPAGSPFGQSALTQHGTTLSGWVEHRHNTPRIFFAKDFSG